MDSIPDRALINQLAASDSSPSSRNIVLKASITIYFYKLRISKDKVITYKVSRLEGLRADYLSTVIYIGY